jgi:hypothetical protein
MALIFPKGTAENQSRRGIADPRGGFRSDVKRLVSSALLRFVLVTGFEDNGRVEFSWS